MQKENTDMFTHYCDVNMSKCDLTRYNKYQCTEFSLIKLIAARKLS